MLDRAVVVVVVIDIAVDIFLSFTSTFVFRFAVQMTTRFHRIQDETFRQFGNNGRADRFRLGFRDIPGSANPVTEPIMTLKD